LQVYLAEVSYDLTGAACKKRCRLRCVPDPNHKAEASGAGRGDACGRIFEYHRSGRQSCETPRCFEEHVRSGLAAQAEAVEILAVHASIEKLRQTTST
jgi:hypothetical protein